MTFHRVWILALSVLLPTAALAQPGWTGAGLGFSSDIVARLAKVERLLEKDKWDKAQREIDEQVEKALERGAYNAVSGSDVAVLMTLQALIQVQRGEREDGLWTWYIAQNLDRGVLRIRRFAVYGEPWEFLSANPLRQWDGSVRGRPIRTQQELRSDWDVEFTPPVVKEEKDAEFWRPFQRLDRELRFYAQVIVDREGKTDQPVVLDGLEYPLLVYFGVIGLRDWRYEPGTVDGEPAEMFEEVELRLRQRRW